MKKNILKQIVLVIFVGILVWCLSITLRFPYLGISLEQATQGHWVINKLNNDSFSEKYDLQVGDIVRKINGKSPGEYSTVKKWGIVEKANHLFITRDGSDRDIFIQTNNKLTYDIFPVLEGILSLLLGGILYMTIRHSKSARLLSFVFLAIGTIWISFGASVRGDEIGKIFIGSFMMCLHIFFLQFLVIFFKEKGDIHLPINVFKYLYALVILDIFIRFSYFSPTLAPIVYRYINNVPLFFFIPGFLINIFILSYVFFKYHKQKPHLSTMIKTVWICILLSFLPVICLSFVPLLVNGSYYIHANYTSWFILLFPASFAYLIASNQLYDIGLVLRRFMLAGMISIVPSGVFTVINALMFQPDASMKHLLFQFVILLVLFTFVLYGMEYFTGKLEPLLFPKKAALNKALKKISKNLGTISNFRELKDIILVDIVDTLQVAGGAIAFKSNDQLEIIHAGQIDADEVERLVQSPFPYHHSSYSCIEINRNEEYSSCLLMTRKKTNTLLGKEEIQWLNLITSYLAVCLENVHLIRKMTLKLQQLASQLPEEQEARDIQWFRKIMFELQEEERTRIATDLHDTTMQDLFFLKRRFVSLLNKYVMNNEDKEQLDNLINFVELINTNLRQSCFELHPFLLQEIGLIRTVGKLIEKESYLVPFKIELAADNASAIENKDLPEKKHIFRMVQELLNNAKKHSQAANIEFRLYIAGDFFHLVYKDDGVGFDQKAAASREIGGSGIGLEQLRGRILHLGGSIEIKSSPGNGATFHIAIPLNTAGSRFQANVRAAKHAFSH